MEKLVLALNRLALKSLAVFLPVDKFGTTLISLFSYRPFSCSCAQHSASNWNWFENYVLNYELEIQRMHTFSAQCTRTQFTGTHFRKDRKQNRSVVRSSICFESNRNVPSVPHSILLRFVKLFAKRTSTEYLRIRLYLCRIACQRLR